MKLMNYGITALVTAGMTVFPAISMAKTARTCPSGEPTQASDSWNFKKEASQLLTSVRQDAESAENSAGYLKEFATQRAISWESHVAKLESVKAAVNDMGTKLCRLEAIRSMLDPWQQKAIDEVVPVARLAADNADSAIKYVNQYKGDFWLAAYKQYVNNLYTETTQMSNSVHQLQLYAKVHKEDMNLGKTLGMSAGM